jgi:hypothetical protein
MGVLRTGTKSDLLSCLQDLTPVNENASSCTVQVTILDGAAIANMLRPSWYSQDIPGLYHGGVLAIHLITASACSQTRHHLGCVHT